MVFDVLREHAKVDRITTAHEFEMCRTCATVCAVTENKNTFLFVKKAFCRDRIKAHLVDHPSRFNFALIATDQFLMAKAMRIMRCAQNWRKRCCFAGMVEKITYSLNADAPECEQIPDLDIVNVPFFVELTITRLHALQKKTSAKNA
jgi:hypothetical protein